MLLGSSGLAYCRRCRDTRCMHGFSLTGKMNDRLVEVPLALSRLTALVKHWIARIDRSCVYIPQRVRACNAINLPQE